MADITKPEIREDQVGWDLDSVLFLKNTGICRVTHNRVDAGGNRVGKQVITNLQDRVDDLETPEDETLTEFTDLIQTINSGSNILQSVNEAVKTHYGI